ncbi:MAG: hypothetical protein GKR92_12350 [Gammaproteobacteria bacterium]|nr:MAG: hypothetical protein GKR92_12350 [Gammaproteobacteria bacterium]
MKLLATFVMTTMLSLISCSSLDGELSDAQNARNKHLKDNNIEFMPLEIMFPDPKVRALAKAAGNGDLDTIEKLVDEGVDVNSKGKRKATPIIVAFGNIHGFRKLLELGADPNVVYDDGTAVMHWAARHRDIAFLKAALEHNGDPNIVDSFSFKETTLIASIRSDGKFGEYPQTILLLDAGADLDKKDAFGGTAVIKAAILKRYDIVYELLNRGADYTIETDRYVSLSSLMHRDRSSLNKSDKSYVWFTKSENWLNDKGFAVKPSVRRGIKVDIKDGPRS